MEDLTKNWNNLSLSDKEDTGFVLPKVHESRDFIIAAKFLTSHYLLMEAVVRTLKQLWRFANGFKVRNLGDHIVLFVLIIAQTWKEFFKINLGVLISIWW